MIVQIPPAERGRFEQFILRFRDRWHAEFSGQLGIDHFDGCLPPKTDPLRRAVLLEIVAIDLVTRIERGDQVSVLTYVKLHDELGTPERLPVKLLHIEYLHRLRTDNPISVEAFASMFPAQAAEFIQLIRSTSQASAPASGTLVLDPVAEMLEIRPIPARPKQHSREDSQITERGSGNAARNAQPDPWGTISKSTERIVSPESGYRMIRKIGQGNFGEVWLSEAPGGVEVALKIVRIPAGQKTKHLEMRSLDLMKRMRHPFLMQVQAFWVTEEQILIAMELADHSLRDRARESGSEGMPLPELLRYMTEAAEGIDFLHREHVVHRDIKPENLLLLKGHIKVADFGLARFMDESGLTVVATQVAGSPLYMAPEVWEGKPVPFSDQYSLAVMYAELRMGRAPFSTSSMVAVMQQHLYGQPQLDGLSEAEQAVLRVALSKHANDRYATCSEMVQGLVDATDSLLAPEPALTPKSSSAWSWALIPLLVAIIAIAAIAYSNWPVNPVSLTATPVIMLRAEVELAYGEQISLEISALDPSDIIEQVSAKDTPPGVMLEFNKTQRRLDLSVDLNAPVGQCDVELTISTPRDEVTKKLRVSVVHSQRLSLPAGTRPTSLESRRINSAGQIVYDRIVYTLLSGERIEFLFIPRELNSDPPAFYIMKQEVSNRWFTEFATADPGNIRADSQWQQGAIAGAKHLGVVGEYLDYPVVNVSVEEAHAFAQWIGGWLPTSEQWDKAAGAKQKDPGTGPFRTEGTEICVNRLNLGPLPCATSADDFSPLGIYDMAGSVKEFTRNILNLPEVVPLQERVSNERVIERGSSYHDPEPWKYNDASLPPSLEYDKSLPDVGFRVVIEIPVNEQT